MAEPNARVGVRLHADGRLSIPNHFRKVLCLEPGEELDCWVEGDRLVLRSRGPRDDPWTRYEGIEGFADSIIRGQRGRTP